jgi:hypothetical protein
MFFGLNDVGFLAAVSAPPAPLLLDLYPNAAAAYSLRQLRTGVTSVVRVRRNSDNAEQDFAATEVSDGTLAAWVGAGNNGFVQTWYDQSGNNKNAIQTSSILQPTIVGNGSQLQINNKPAISVNRGPYLESTLQLAFPFSAFWTVYPNGNPVNAFDRFAGSSGAQFRYRAGKLGGFFGVELDGPVLSGQAQHQNTYLGVSSSLIGTAANGSSLVDTAGAFSISTGSFSIGRATTTAQFNGLIQEGIIYLSDQSTNRTAIEANINAHYAIY